MSDAKNRTRQPAGVPVGGEYARETGVSTGISLVPGHFEVIVRAGTDAANFTASDYPLVMVGHALQVPDVPVILENGHGYEFSAGERWRSATRAEQRTFRAYHNAVHDALERGQDETAADTAGRRAAASATPVQIVVGNTHVFGAGDDQGIAHFEIVRDEDGYHPEATVRAGALHELIIDLDAETFDEVIASPEYRAVLAFLASRYRATPDIDDDGGLTLIVHGDTFEEPISEDMAVEQVQGESGRILNETDPGTYGSQYVGRLLREHLDTRVFVDAPDLTPTASAKVTAARAAASWTATRRPFTDAEAVATIATIGTERLRDLAAIGNADREAFRREVLETLVKAPSHAASDGARGLLAWVDAQQPFSTRIGR